MEIVNRSPLFITSRFDHCGLMLTTSGVRGSTACMTYNALFVCFPIKAIHKEIVHDPNTEAFNPALRDLSHGEENSIAFLQTT